MTRRDIGAAAAGAVMATVLAGSVAWAAIPGDGGVYTACMLKNVGTVRLIDKSLPPGNFMSHCKPALEVEVSWNQNGQPGQAGEKGDPGSTGMQGPPGISNLTQRDSFTPANSEDFKFLDVACPAGQRALGGGGRILPDLFGHVALTASQPGGDRWSVHAHEVGGGTAQPWTLFAYVVCADAS